MMTRHLPGTGALLALTATVACSQAATPVASPALTIEDKEPGMSRQTVVPCSYIVKAPGDGAAVIRRVFAQFGVLQVNSLGNEQFELRLERDPGLEVLKSLAAKSRGGVTTIQPNFIYRAN